MRFFSEYFICHFYFLWPKILRIIFTPKTICCSRLFSNRLLVLFLILCFSCFTLSIFYCYFSKIISNLVSCWAFYFCLLVLLFWLLVLYFCLLLLFFFLFILLFILCILLFLLCTLLFLFCDLLFFFFGLINKCLYFTKLIISTKIFFIRINSNKFAVKIFF